ncbi:MAG: hypothetical protein V2I66_17050 [Halieaceae bacterium]|nr:hypothetical protein [Halieaceae bacterium]
MKTRDLEPEHITVEFTEFEMTALAALVERGQLTVDLDDTAGESHGIRQAIHSVAEEFRSLLGHFELTSPASEQSL